ncbi:hypothetical protein IB642_00680 [Allofrancisella guangzhouensis]|uniref:Uncharacterized protein n=1 Tax=Allofrancisella guangzhouensis TaxID=594679 RepID=A0A0A8E371_9GAMM|nr:hypothetical protein [Allofrancisella guangzhouensis]AJC48419.1 hypothetical protein SD28_01480 [Allofrancisella guangzhouensis]MBK2027311.1 hypothetical protein [Allofrancisella guangzhouensis]MBK2043533.1 hypothetical protein [Allofrancisella guangzhouensis]MBK2045465.1 hypothetical protein [Allofrancisella guangzhouensis]
MKKTFFLSLTFITTLSFANTYKGTSINITSGSSTVSTQQISIDTPPVSKNIDETKIQKIGQSKQKEQLVGSNPATWTPAYLSVKSFKKCLEIQKYRGWEGYCMPVEKNKDCPSKSWEELKKMNLVPCVKDVD